MPKLFPTRPPPAPPKASTFPWSKPWKDRALHLLREYVTDDFEETYALATQEFLVESFADQGLGVVFAPPEEQGDPGERHFVTHVTVQPGYDSSRRHAGSPLTLAGIGPSARDAWTNLARLVREFS